MPVKKFTTLSLIFMLMIGCQENSEQKTEIMNVAEEAAASAERLPLVKDAPIKNVILFIGDGTGLAQLSAGQLALVGPDRFLNIQSLPVTGIVTTHASNNLITDSAAGATAYSCGLKTYNGAIGVDSEGRPCTTILELAELKGLSTGLVSTSGITHATPASFGAHVESRRMQEEIAAQYLNSGAEVLLGGGIKWFSKEQRKDQRDLMSEFRDAGYEVINEVDGLQSATGDRLLGLFAEDGLERVEGEPTTAQLTEKALNVLSKDDDGFFLMVEGSQIDWGGHANNTDYVIREVKDFDEAVKKGLDFAVEDGETLVVVTADHETGGMTMNKQVAEGDSLEIYWVTDYHTGIPVPLMAYGPHATEFMGWRDNTYIGQKLAELLKVGSLPQRAD